jgi:uncharacterized protein with HEPN domain
MLPEERDAAYLWDMIQAAKEVEDMIENHDLVSFLNDRVLMRALERCVEIVGETARRVSSGFKEEHPEIPWREIIGQRNILAHEYGQIDHELLFNTVTNDIPELIVMLNQLLPPLEED